MVYENQNKIPKGWKQLSFKECSNQKPKSKYKKLKTKEYLESGLYPIIDQGKEFIAGYTDNKGNLYQGPLPVIIFGDHTLYVKFIDTEFAVGADGTVLLYSNKNIITDKFYYYLISNHNIESEGYQRHLKYLKQKYFLVPPTTEQNKIAKILSTVDDAIENTDAIIEETQQLKKGLMEKLFIEGIGHTRFKKTKIGRIPEEWTIEPAEKVCQSVTDGTHDTPKPTEKGRLLVTAKNIKSGILTFEDCYYISEDDYKNIIKRSRVDQYDILYGMIGASVGYAVIVKQEDVNFAIKNVGLFKMGGDSLLSEWVYNYLSSPKALNFVYRHKGGAARDFAPLGLLRKFPIPMTLKIEMGKINSIFAEINEKLVNEQNYKSELEQLKKGLLQVLLTGNIRVKV